MLSHPSAPNPTTLLTSIAGFVPTHTGNPICTTNSLHHSSHTGGHTSLHDLSVPPGWASTLLVLASFPCDRLRQNIALLLASRPSLPQMPNLLWTLPFAARAIMIPTWGRVGVLERTLRTLSMLRTFLTMISVLPLPKHPTISFL